MPRQPRIDIPGLLHHVIFRGINGCKIVKDDTDRLGFVARLGKLAEECLQRICEDFAIATQELHSGSRRHPVSAPPAF